VNNPHPTHHADTEVIIFNSLDQPVHQEKLGYRAAGTNIPFRWYGDVEPGLGNPYDPENDGTFRYYAKDGVYKISITPTDSPGSSHPAIGLITVHNSPAPYILVKGYLKPMLKTSHLASESPVATALEGFKVKYMIRMAT